MVTLVRALSARDDLWAVVTAVLPIVADSDEMDADVVRDRYGDLLAALGLDADSERDLALLTGAVEMSRWVVISAELAGVDPEKWWRRYVETSRG